MPTIVCSNQEVELIPEKFQVPTQCPSCKSKLEFDGVNLWCRNHSCPEKKLAQILNWFDTIGFKGFSESFFQKLWDKGIHDIYGIYQVTPEFLRTVDGIGESTIKNFFNEIDRTSKMSPETFLAALGIQNLGNSKSELLLQKCGNIDKVFEITADEMVKIPTFGTIMATNIRRGLLDAKEMAKKLMSMVVLVQKSGNLLGKSFCVTGALETMGRDAFKNMVINNGGIYKTSVSRGLTYLVTNDTGSGSGKNAKAKQCGTEIIDEKKFLSMIK
jgi:DNA ligase (NAD+)